MTIDLMLMKDKLRVDYKLHFWMSSEGYLSFDAECVLTETNQPIAWFEFRYQDDQVQLKKCKYINNKPKYSGLKKLLNDILSNIEVDFLDYEVEILLHAGRIKGSFDASRPYIG